MKKNITQLIKIVAILRGLEKQAALKAVDVFHAAGIRAVEVTYNTKNAPDIIASLQKRYDKELLIGAGTILNCEQLESARQAGASFILSPDCNEEVIRATKKAGLFSVPGACTATEVTRAVAAGADIVKLFPAGSLGPGYLKDLLGPLDKVQFMVVGGINAHNLPDFFAAGAVAAGIGSSLVNKELIKTENFKELQKIAGQFANLVR